jgi:hypothetical protein
MGCLLLYFVTNCQVENCIYSLQFWNLVLLLIYTKYYKHFKKWFIQHEFCI